MPKTIDYGGDSINVGKFEGYYVKSGHESIKAPILTHGTDNTLNTLNTLDLDKEHEEVNFPQINNLKNDLEDILHRRASFIQLTHKK